jgi:hypothetical protein
MAAVPGGFVLRLEKRGLGRGLLNDACAVLGTARTSEKTLRSTGLVDDLPKSGLSALNALLPVAQVVKKSLIIQISYL